MASKFVPDGESDDGHASSVGPLLISAVRPTDNKNCASIAAEHILLFSVQNCILPDQFPFFRCKFHKNRINTR
jgi:hypothetical protein